MERIKFYKHINKEVIIISQAEFEQIKRNEEYKKFIYNVDKVSRFELMDI